MERWCVFNPDGRALPEPVGDSRDDAVKCFCALSELSWEYFEGEGYSVGLLPVAH